jgi:hypothetical protein
VNAAARGVTFALGLALVAAARDASAAGPEAPEALATPEALAREVNAAATRVGEELATRACDEACRALASMRRAADRLCALEPGDRCERARQQTEASAQRVQAACPECTVASGPSPKDQVVAAPAKPSSESSPVSHTGSERTTRGCASCTAGGRGNVNDAAASTVLTALVLAFVRGRRPRTKRSQRGRA